MQIFIRKIFSIMLLCLGLCACSSNESSPEISGEDLTHAENDEQVYALNNKANLFGEYLFINSMRTNLIFNDKDETGNYHSWQFPDDLLPGVMRTYSHFKYKECIS